MLIQWDDESTFLLSSFERGARAHKTKRSKQIRVF